MAKHKTLWLEGTLLDAAVAYSLGYKETADSRTIADAAIGSRSPVLVRTASGKLSVIGLDLDFGQLEEWAPSRQWHLGGPIIERQQITLCGPDFMVSKLWEAYVEPAQEPATSSGPTRIVGKYMAYGPTPLVAAMRCFVMCRLGEEVEMPDIVSG